MTAGKSRKTELFFHGLVLALVILFSSAAALPARAEYRDYKVANPDWDDRTAEEGRLYGTWDMAEDKTGYTVTLYRGNTKVGSKQMGEGMRFDFSTFINSKLGGAGKYTFTVFPTRGGTEYMITSEVFEVTSAMVTAIRNRIQAERKAAIAATGGGWVRGPGTIWIYYDREGNQLKNCWVETDGHKYYLDKNGIMLTGWQAINNVYYYLEPKGTVEHPLGSLWVNTTTPDGHKVDETGARLDSTGKQVKPVSYKLLSTVSVSIKESQESGKYTQITGITCGVGAVSDLKFETDPSTWTTDSLGKVTFTVTLTDAYRLMPTFKLSCSRASGAAVVSHTAMTFEGALWYAPKYVLSTPDYLYMSSGYKLCWRKVTHADEYTIKITIAEEDEDGVLKNSTKTVTTTNSYLDLNAEGIDEETIVKGITITAYAKNTRRYINSSAAKIDDFKTFVAERTVPGSFDTNSVGLYYYDENGERASGWKELMGHWYYFKKNGYAAIGWFRDSATNHWYYFDEYGQMVKGTVTLPDGTYTFNDGSRKDLPEGAWIH